MSPGIGPSGVGPDDEGLSPFAGSRCVVTGGLGFIGSNLALALHGAGARVTVIDRLVPRHGGDPRNLEGEPIEVVQTDIGDGVAVGPALTDADYIFNVAGQVSHIDSIEDPLGDFDLNARSHLAFLEIVRRRCPEAVVVHASTRQIYGRPRYLPVDEMHAVEPVDVNGVAKYAGERLHLLYGTIHGLRTTALRLTNVYGPRQRLLGSHQGVLPVYIRTALEHQPLLVFGDGAQERDCLHVDDVVRAFALAATNTDAIGQVFNLGHDEHLSLRVIAEKIAAAAGDGEVRSVEWPPDRARIDIGSYWTDWSKAERELGWRPRIRFDEGVAQTIGFYRSCLDRYL